MPFGRKDDDAEDPQGYQAPPIGGGWVTGFTPAGTDPEQFRVEPGAGRMDEDENPRYEAEPFDPNEGKRSALHPHLVDPAPPAKSHRGTAPLVRRTFFERRIGVIDVLLSLLLACIASGAVILTQKDFGYTWDEALYYEPAQKAIAWARGVAERQDLALIQPTAINQYWGERLDSNDPLHPEVAPLPKMANGAALEWLPPLTQDPLLAMRFPAAVAFGLTIAIAYLLGALEFGRLGGIASAISYGCMPRVFGHAHIAAAETLVTFFIAATVFFFLLSLRRGWLAPAAGLAFGLALASKITAILLPLPLLIWGQLFRRRDYASGMFFLLLLGPVVALLVWPWLWHDTLRRFFSFLLFYADHQSTAVMYMGRLWGYTHGPAAPWHYPWVITAVSLPEWILLLVFLGFVRAVVQVLARPVPVLWVFCALLWLGFSSLPGSPKYDGERLFFPAFFFLGLLAGAGFTGIFDFIAWKESQMTLLRPRNGYGPAPWAAAAVLLCWGIIDMQASHPNQLNYYNWIVGRTAGAYKRGYETSYWHEALNSDVTEWLQTNLQPGDRVKVLAMNGLAFDHLRRWGKLPGDVDFAPSEPPFDYLVLQVRQGFMGRMEKHLHHNVKPLAEFKAQGVPRVQIFRGEDAGLASAQTPEPSTAMQTPSPAEPSPTPAAAREDWGNAPPQPVPPNPGPGAASTQDEGNTSGSSHLASNSQQALTTSTTAIPAHVITRPPAQLQSSHEIVPAPSPAFTPQSAGPTETATPAATPQISIPPAATATPEPSLTPGAALTPGAIPTPAASPAPSPSPTPANGIVITDSPL